MTLLHAYSQTVADGTATSVVRPSDWNSGHNQFVTLAGNTSGASTVSGTNIVYQGGNNVTLSGTGATIIISGGNTSQLAGTGTTLNLTNLNGTLNVGSNGVALSLNNVDANYVAWELEGANTAGTTGTTLTTTGAFYLSGGNNITLSGNSNTIVIQGAAAGGGTTLSAWANNLYQFNSTIIVPRQSTSYVFPALVNDAISFDHIRFPMTVAQGTTTVATTANTTFSLGASYTVNAAFYTTSGTNASSLGSVLTTSGGISHRISIQAGTAGSQYSVSHFYTFPFNTAGSTATVSTTYASSQTNISLSSVTQMTGMKHFELAMSTSLPPNMYWMMIGVSSTTATQGVAGLSAALMNQSHWGMSQPNNTWGFFGQANNASVQAITGVGSFTTAGGGTVAGFGFSNISSQASHPVPYIYMEYDG